jgi:hypothetical protein
MVVPIAEDGRAYKDRIARHQRDPLPGVEGIDTGEVPDAGGPEVGGRDAEGPEVGPGDGSGTVVTEVDQRRPLE